MSFEDRLKVGKKAEGIVEDFLKNVGFEVFRYGWEYTMPRLLKYKITGDASDYIRHMPDFVVLDKYGEAFFVEVKYRSEDEIKDKDLFNYPSCYVFILTKNGILGQNICSLYNGKPFVEVNNLFPFRFIKKEVIDKYDKVVRRKLGDEGFFGQIIKYSILGNEAPKKIAYFLYKGKIIAKEIDKEIVQYEVIEEPKKEDEPINVVGIDNNYNKRPDNDYTCKYCGGWKATMYDQCADCYQKIKNGIDFSKTEKCENCGHSIYYGHKECPICYKPIRNNKG